MTTYSVTSGHTSTSLTLHDSDYLNVSSAGTATFITVAPWLYLSPCPPCYS